MAIQVDTTVITQLSNKVTNVAKDIEGNLGKFAGLCAQYMPCFGADFDESATEMRKGAKDMQNMVQITGDGTVKGYKGTAQMGYSLADALTSTDAAAGGKAGGGTATGTGTGTGKPVDTNGSKPKSTPKPPTGGGGGGKRH
ncbi:hypothetical protein [Streptomyces sp. NPDC000410]|uniref:hypothetical protein n=1 Tax=Streptomyces sp. NPDC000410 TaxID=3154254 RepID=UPI00332A1E9B